jgi:hypothetical protein
MNAIILKGAALRQPPLPQSGPRAKTIAHPCSTPLCLSVVLPPSTGLKSKPNSWACTVLSRRVQEGTAECDHTP